jgi:hypothetical protein
MAQSFYLREQADRCRRLARGASDPVTQERLFKLAAEYEGRQTPRTARTKKRRPSATASAMAMTTRFRRL